MRKKWILLVDDDVEHTFGIEQRLVMDGFLVDRATNARQAWEKMRNRRYYGIIIDIMMPSGGLFKEDETDQDLKTGILLCQKIKQTYNNSMKIIGLTNHQAEAIRDDFISSGGDACFEKMQHRVAGNISQFLVNNLN